MVAEKISGFISKFNRLNSYDFYSESLNLFLTLTASIRYKQKRKQSNTNIKFDTKSMKKSSSLKGLGGDSGV